MASLFGDVVALQEVRLAIDSQKVATEEFDKFGWSVISCKPQPIRRGTVKSVVDTKQGGVRIAFRSHPLTVLLLVKSSTIQEGGKACP